MGREIRVLVTGVGRRVELMQAFRSAAEGLGVALRLYGADSSGEAPALAWCDGARRVRGMREEGYVDELLDVCRADAVDLVVPTIDTDLLALARSKRRFEEIGTRVLVGDPDKVALCRDKRLTGGLFASCGLRAPETYGDWRGYPGPWPCFVKPLDGSSSVGASRAADREELAALASRLERPVVQPLVEGAEYTVDVFCDLDGEPVYVTPRVRLAVRAGEVLRTRVDMDRRIIGGCLALARRFRAPGPLTVQLIRDAETGEDWYIEVNPRFGGGAPLSMRAGARSCEALLRMLLGEGVAYSEPQEDGAVFSRFDQSVRVSGGSPASPLRGVVFDLDDTLYPERAYVRSGFRAVARLLGDPSAEGELWDAFEAGEPALDAVLAARGLEGRKAECLAAYRSHAPEVSPYPGVRELLAGLRSRGVRVGVITDGRPEGQRAKLAALGLGDLVDDVVVTDELGGERLRKPCDVAYRLLLARWALPPEAVAYVGDNPAKDFSAPARLGMRSVWFDNPEGLHRGSPAGDAPVVDRRVESVEEMAAALLGMAEPRGEAVRGA